MIFPPDQSAPIERCAGLSNGEAWSLPICEGDAALEGVDREQPGRLPVRGPVPALTVILQASQLPAVSPEPVKQLQHRLTALRVVLTPRTWRGRGATPGGRTTRGCGASVTCSNGYSASRPAGRCAALRQPGRRHMTCTPTSATWTRSCGRAHGAPSAPGGRRRSPARRWMPPCTGSTVTLIYLRCASTRSAPTSAPAGISPGWQPAASLPGGRRPCRR
jgi:hypothetical protein